VDPATIRFDELTWGATTHANYNRTLKDRVWQASKTRHRDSTVGGQLLGLDHLSPHHASTGHCAAPVPGVENSPNLFVLLGAGAK
jgi:hypothetical protein